jgi:hypothetical protein
VINTLPLTPGMGMRRTLGASEAAKSRHEKDVGTSRWKSMSL